MLDEEKLRLVIEENRRINATPQAQSQSVRENDIAFGWKQGIQEIRWLLICAFADGFQSYDYYLPDRLEPDVAGEFYANRVRLLKEWLADDMARARLSDAEKAYLIRQYEALETPFYYDYMQGWVQLTMYFPTIIMIMMLILGYLVSGIFSNEFVWKADAIFFTADYGRDKAVAAKIKAGFVIVSVIYWTVIFLYTAIVLLYLGADGASCPVQADRSGWKCFYNITVWQEYLLVVAGGYIGCLFISSLVMLVSAKARSAVLAVMLPFVLIFLPSFLENINSPAVNKVLGLLPDRLLRVGAVIAWFDLYELGGRVIGAIPILLALYGILTILLLPVTYLGYRHTQIV